MFATMDKKLRALGHYVILKRIEPKTKTNSYGLDLSEDHRKDVRYIRGEVVSVGDLVTGMKPGDTVLYDKVAGNGLEIDDELLKCVTIRDIVTVFEDGEV